MIEGLGGTGGDRSARPNRLTPMRRDFVAVIFPRTAV
jgi:hypothetical protein